MVCLVPLHLAFRNSQLTVQPRLMTKSNEKAITAEFREITGAS